MRIFKENELNLPASILTIGAFDGMHLGHQSLVKQVVNTAKKKGVPSVVYTFDPPPKAFFQQKKILTMVEEKIELLKQYQVDYVIVAKFTRVYASIAPIEFIHEIKQLHPKKVIIGPNFKFGKNQQGDINLLTKHCNVIVQPFVLCENNEVISSTRIRELINDKKVIQAETLLGRSLEKNKSLGGVNNG